jgi:hypothetical protein
MFRMKKTALIKILSALTAICISAAMLAGCSDSSTDTNETTSSSSEASDTDETTVPESDEDEVYVETTRAVQDGDVYAINKFTVSSLPADYRLFYKSQEEQGEIYLNSISQITVNAANYREDYTDDLSAFAESACASLKVTNMLFKCDTDFEEPESTSVAGFDAIRYDYLVTQNEFVKENDDDEGDGVKTPVAYYKYRAYFFYSDNDVYYVIFETTQENWDSAIDGFEEFMANVTINEDAVNEETEDNPISSETSAE